MPIEIDLRENAFVKWGEELGKASGLAEGLASGERLGMARGEQLGIAKGESKTLTKILELRFGHLPEAIRARIASDASTLDLWVDRVVDAASLDAVFGE